VNHPEPPTQTYGAYAMDLEAIANGTGDDGGAMEIEEPAHMLHSDTLYEIAQCLANEKVDGDGDTGSMEGGQLIIVTDNRWYANLICCTVVKLMRKHAGLLHSGRSDDTDTLLRRVEEFPISRSTTTSTSTTEDTTTAATPKVILYEGRPNEFIECVTGTGHHQQHQRRREPRTGEGGGTSYFDRLWRSGAGTHAETKRRFVIYLTTTHPTTTARRDDGTRYFKSGGGGNGSGNRIRRPQSKRRVPFKTASGGSGKLGTMKRNKKRGDEKQKRRNAKRLLKKKGQQQEQP